MKALVLILLLAACQRGGTYPHGVFVRDMPENPYGGLTDAKTRLYDLHHPHSNRRRDHAHVQSE